MLTSRSPPAILVPSGSSSLFELDGESLSTAAGCSPDSESTLVRGRTRRGRAEDEVFDDLFKGQAPLSEGDDQEDAVTANLVRVLLSSDLVGAVAKFLDGEWALGRLVSRAPRESLALRFEQIRRREVGFDVNDPAVGPERFVVDGRRELGGVVAVVERLGNGVKRGVFVAVERGDEFLATALTRSISSGVGASTAFRATSADAWVVACVSVSISVSVSDDPPHAPRISTALIAHCTTRAVLCFCRLNMVPSSRCFTSRVEEHRTSLARRAALGSSVDHGATAPG